MSADIGVSYREAVEEHIGSSKKLKLIWKIALNHKSQSVVGCVQIYSDTSQTLLKAGDLTIYPLHKTLLNFSEQSRRLQSLSGDIILKYLLVSFYSSISETIQD